MFIFGLSLHASSNSEPGSVSGSVTVSVVSRRAGGRGSWPHYQPRFNLSGSDTKTTHTPPSHSPGLLCWHYMLHVLWSEVMSLGPGEVMTPAQWLNNDQHLHRCQEVRWGSHQRVTIISFLICQHCAMISDDAPTGYCKSSLWFIGQQFSVALGCGLIDSSDCDSSGRSQVWTIHQESSSLSPPQWPPSSGSVLILDRLSPLSF